jgi:hypothetical protein
MRPIAPFCLLDSVQVSDDHLIGTAPTHGFSMVSDSLFVDHVPMTKERVSKLPPAVLEIIVNHLAPHTFGLIGDLTHHTAR